MLCPIPAVRPVACSRAPSTRALWLALAAVTALWAIAASQWVLSGTVVPWDAKNQSYAFFRFLASALDSGSSPFWNPYHYGGHPSVADPQSLIFAPAFIAWAWFDPSPSMMTFDLIVFAHLLVGGLALAAIGWRFSWPLPAILLAAAVFMLGGPASGRLQHTGMIISYGLFPPALLLITVALERRSIAIAAAFAVVAAVLVLQRNHVSLLLSFVLAALCLAELVSAADRRAWLRARAGVIGTAAAVGFFLIAAPLLLTVQFAGLSNRPQVELNESLTASLHPVNLANLAVANVMGSLERTYTYWGPSHETAPEVGATDRSFNYVFVGTTTTLILVWLGIAGGGLWQRGRRMLTAILAAALVYALGRYTPLYALAFEYLPGIDLFRRPSDSTFIFVAAMAILVGHLLADFARDGLPRVRWTVAAPASLAVLGMLVWAIAFAGKTGHAADTALELGKAALVATLAGGLLLWASRQPSRRQIAAAGLALLAAGELVIWNTTSSLNAEPPGYYAVLEQPQGEDAKALAILKRELAARHREGKRPRVEVVGLGGPWQNLPMVQELEATNGYNPIRIGWYDRLVSPGETTHVARQRQFPSSFDGYDCVLARELGLEYVVLGQPIEQMPHLARRPVAEVLMEGPKIWIYRLANAEPRVEFIRRVMVANVDPDVQAGRFRVSPEETALIDDQTPPMRSYLPTLVKQSEPEARIVSWKPDRVEVTVESRHPGVLVLHDAYYPGWEVEVDGQPQRMLRANVLFRGVELTEGRHTVVFAYRPFALRNLGDALAGLLARPSNPGQSP